MSKRELECAEVLCSMNDPTREEVCGRDADDPIHEDHHVFAPKNAPALGWSIKRFADAMDYKNVAPVYEAIYRGEIPTFKLHERGEMRIPAKWAEEYIANQIAHSVFAEAKSAPPTHQSSARRGVATAGGDSTNRSHR